jgi:hypothetical protein
MSLLRSRRRWLAIGVNLVCSLWLAAAANAIPIGDYSVADLDNQTVLTSGNGQLSFTRFEFYLGEADPADFTLSVLDDGVRLTGPMSVADGAQAEFYFSYEVSVLGDAPGINGVSLYAPSEITGGGYPTFVKTAKQIYAGPTPEFFHQDTLALLTTRNFEGPYSEFASASFAPQSLITVLDGARLSAAGPGDTATLTELTNRFSVVPEPGTLALLGVGFFGLGIARRRR